MEGTDLSRIADGLDRLADALESWVKLEQQRFEHEYPTRNPSPATVAVAKYADDLPKENPEEQGAVLPEEEIAGIGPRERALLEKQKTAPRRKRSQE